MMKPIANLIGVSSPKTIAILALTSGIVLSGVLSSFQTIACGLVLVGTKDGTYVMGRSLEFGVFKEDRFAKGASIDTKFVSFPRGSKFAAGSGSKEDPQTNNFSWTAKYGFSGMGHGASALKDGLLSEGINEAGLHVAALWFEDGTYGEPRGEGKNLPQYQFAAWVLSQFGSVKEAVEAIRQITIYGGFNDEWHQVFPFHWAISDKSGNFYVIEHIDGALNVTDARDIRVMTNSPRIEWHKTNYENFKKDFPRLDAKTKTGERGLLNGLPGSWTSPDRFIRLAIQRDLSEPLESVDTALNQSVHLLNTVDYVTGVPEMLTRGAGTAAQETSWISIIDPVRRDYYFRTQDSLNVHKIDLDQIDYREGSAPTAFDIYGGSPYVDVTAKALGKTSDQSR